MAKEQLLTSSQTKQSVSDLTFPGKRNVTGEMKIIESKILDSTIANFMNENALQFNVAEFCRSRPTSGPGATSGRCRPPPGGMRRAAAG